MAVDHYENFPVASLLMPPRLRPAVRDIYAFARSADDIADEGSASDSERLQGLAAYCEDLDRIASGEPAHHPILSRLASTIADHDLPIAPFHDLLSAFSQDVKTERYANFAVLSDYCRRSANPVGTLMLHLYRAASAENLHLSDQICTALQLTNFWQDVAIDWQKARIYIPQEDMKRFGVTERHIAEGVVDPAWRALMAFEVARTRQMMQSGAPLVHRLPGRIGWELRCIVQGGMRILERLDTAGYDVFNRRPVLAWKDWLRIGHAALRMRGPRT